MWAVTSRDSSELSIISYYAYSLVHQARIQDIWVISNFLLSHKHIFVLFCLGYILICGISRSKVMPITKATRTRCHKC